VTAAALKVPILLSGLNTLRLKETDRLLALHSELKKIGVQCEIGEGGILEIKSFDGEVDSEIAIDTFNDHRMAMAFASLALVHPNIVIENPDVVKKSYPCFWEEVNKFAR